MTQRTLSGIGTGIASCAFLAPASSAQYTRTLALTGEQAKGMPDGLVYFSPFAPQRDLIIDAQDRILTQIAAFDPGDTNRVEVGLYSGSSGATFMPVARTGAELINAPGVFPKLFGQMNINAGGLIFAAADLQGPLVTTANDLGLLSSVPGANARMIARQGSPAAPDLPPTITNTSFFGPVVNKSGLLAVGLFLGGATNDANNTGIYLRRPTINFFERLAYESAPVPDVANPVFGQSLLARLNDNNDLLIATGLAGSGIAANVNDSALWTGSSTASLVRIAQSGNQAPGLPAGVNYSSFGAQTLNKVGRYAFTGNLTGSVAGQVTTANDNAIFVGTKGSPANLLVREGDLAAIPGNTTSRYSGTLAPALAGNGMVVFSAFLTNRGFNADTGLFAGTVAADLAPVAVEGQRAPGTPTGGIFYADFSNQSAFPRYSVNAAGQIVFLASLKYGASTTAHEGLFLKDPVQGLICLVRTGGTIDVNGIPKTVTDLALGQTGNGQDGQGSPFNDRGTVAFQASGPDFSGIFTMRAPIVGDVNLDGLVSFTDYQLIQRYWHTTDADRTSGDLNGDRSVDSADFALFYANLGHSVDDPPLTPAQQEELDAFAATAPEPTCLGALLLTTPLLRRRRRLR
jgi:hypothetical protein